jgi:hypothetical protein
MYTQHLSDYEYVSGVYIGRYLRCGWPWAARTFAPYFIRSQWHEFLVFAHLVFVMLIDVHVRLVTVGGVFITLIQNKGGNLK